MQTVEFILHGVDASSGTYLAWESAQCPPAYAVLDRARLTEAVESLARALPDYLEQDSEPSEHGFDEVFPPVRPSRARRREEDIYDFLEETFPYEGRGLPDDPVPEGLADGEPWVGQLVGPSGGLSL